MVVGSRESSFHGCYHSISLAVSGGWREGGQREKRANAAVIVEGKFCRM
jgi:hypothetical protein